jgi:hypothetical protein
MTTLWLKRLVSNKKLSWFIWSNELLANFPQFFK